MLCVTYTEFLIHCIIPSVRVIFFPCKQTETELWVKSENIIANVWIVCILHYFILANMMRIKRIQRLRFVSGVVGVLLIHAHARTHLRNRCFLDSLLLLFFFERLSCLLFELLLLLCRQRRLCAKPFGFENVRKTLCFQKPHAWASIMKANWNSGTAC